MEGFLPHLMLFAVPLRRETADFFVLCLCENGYKVLWILNQQTAMVTLVGLRNIGRVCIQAPVSATVLLALSVLGSSRAYLQLMDSSEASISDVRSVLREADQTGLDTTVKESISVSNLGLQPAKALYALCRLLKPRVVVETGVAEGISSAYILKALSENGEGELHSVDVAEFTESGGVIGYVVPENLRGRWHLNKGRSQQLLPRLAKGLGLIDIFVHDSDHSYDVIVFELETAYPYLRKGGVLVADDVFQNMAFFDSCKKFRIKPIVLGWRIGVGRKEVEQH